MGPGLCQEVEILVLVESIAIEKESISSLGEALEPDSEH